MQLQQDDWSLLLRNTGPRPKQRLGKPCYLGLCLLLGIQAGNTWQNLPFKKFKACPSSCRDVAHLGT